MARAAFLMDKLMSRLGLSGKSFIPLLSSFACAVPGIMATLAILLIAVGIAMSGGGSGINARLERYASTKPDKPAASTSTRPATRAGSASATCHAISPPRELPARMARPTPSRARVRGCRQAVA